MTDRKPLDLVEKWKVAQFWVSRRPGLTRGEMLVLLKLLDRQNPRTGRCDPSARSLCEDTGLSERAVRAAFGSLKRREAIAVRRRAGGMSNQFQIRSVAEVAGSHQKKRSRSCNSVHVTQHSTADRPAETRAFSMQAASPKKENETKKKNEAAENGGTARGSRSSGPTQEPKPDVGLAEFERRTTMALERARLEYVALIDLPAGSMENAYEDYQSGKRTLIEAIDALVEACRNQIQR